MFRQIEWPRPQLAPDEAIRFSTRANWSRRGLARGGTLLLTDRRLIFEPNSVEGSIGLVAKDWPRSTIRSVEIAPRTFGVTSGGLRRRLQVQLDGSAERFVVGDVDEVVQRLAALLASSG